VTYVTLRSTRQGEHQRAREGERASAPGPRRGAGDERVDRSRPVDGCRALSRSIVVGPRDTVDYGRPLRNDRT
jgi:hypothetical protein